VYAPKLHHPDFRMHAFGYGLHIHLSTDLDMVTVGEGGVIDDGCVTQGGGSVVESAEEVMSFVVVQ